MTARLLSVAVVCAALCVALGVWVTHHPPARIDLPSAAIRGTNVPLAVALTTLGYGPALTCAGVATIAAALLFRQSVKLPLTILFSQLLSQGVVNVIKGVFGRPRPALWLYRHEPGMSFPSGHATTAIVFYGAWLVVVWLMPLPLAVRVAGAAVLSALIVGIGWSRLVPAGPGRTLSDRRAGRLSVWHGVALRAHRVVG